LWLKVSPGKLFPRLYLKKAHHTKGMLECLKYRLCVQTPVLQKKKKKKKKKKKTKMAQNQECVIEKCTYNSSYL
jgi:hypothetical protein